jgi:alpha-beta hydrolase superfamily lysophospholipase
MDDGYRLPLRHWGNTRKPRLVLLAVHGFNDYANAFSALGTYLSSDAVLTYAYDQRGFGATIQRGRWAGTGRLAADLRALTELLSRRHPKVPIYLLGESMGAALVMVAAARQTLAVGYVLLSPALWSRDTMHPVQRFALWAASHTVPWLEVTGRGLDIRPSDNLAMLRAYSADPMVIKETRIDSLWGVTNLMDKAAAVRHLPRPALILYGEKDQIIPKRAFCGMLERLPRPAPGLRLALYDQGWHMLTRDLQGERVMADIAAWLSDTRATLPSGQETAPGDSRLSELCGRSRSRPFFSAR